MDLIKLPIYLALKVNEELKKIDSNYQTRFEKGIFSFKFTKEELGKIKRLKIVNPIHELDGIEELYNLEVLSIYSTGINSHKLDKDISSIKDEDIDKIKKCKKLKILSIENQHFLKSIDLNGFDNLQCLEISKNLNLQNIYSIETLDNLEFFECYGNEKLFYIDELDKYIENNKKLNELNLDILLYPNAIGYINGYENKKAVEKMNSISDVLWSEKLVRGSIKINNYQMRQMFLKSLDILKLNTSSINPLTSIIEIEKYMADNIKYDHDGKNSKLRMHFKDGIGVGPIGGVNSAFNAIMFNYAVCEGYTRAMQFLLKLKGINSHNVDCFGDVSVKKMASIDQNDKYEFYKMTKEDYNHYHSIICIDDYMNLYDDPCWNAVLYQRGNNSFKYLLLSKSDIENTHTLSFDERNIKSGETISREIINKILNNKEEIKRVI
jgi:hypothetical protein